MYKQIRSVVAADFEAVDRYIVEQLRSDVPLVENIGQYLVEAGGKRMRPVTVLLAARACGIEGGSQVKLATVVEFIHTSTLLHDDVVDTSTMRRGRPTANHKWNNPSSVLVGDFIYSRAFQILVEIGDMRIMKVIADTTNAIAEGEVMQLINKHNADASESDYMKVIRNKTAILFQAAAQCGGILAEAKDDVVRALSDFGMHVGMAFQLVDDVLDYDGDAATMGKNIGDDLAEGKPTLPLIYATAHSSPDAARLIREQLIRGREGNGGAGLEALPRIIEIVRQSGALDYTRDMAEREIAAARRCLERLPQNRYSDALARMAEFAIRRDN